MMAMPAETITAASAARGGLRQDRAEDQQGGDHQRGRHQGDDLAAAAQRGRHGGAAGAGGDREPLEGTGGQSGHPQVEQLLVRVDAVPVPGGDRPGRQHVVGGRGVEPGRAQTARAAISGR